MDDLVKRALARWPNVPDCYGWLALDARGRWRLGTERETITHAPMSAFISRNYASDEAGRWLFQNGPQKVYVDLDYTPFVWRMMPDPDQTGRWTLTDHTGQTAEAPQAAWIDTDGRFLLRAADRIGVVHDHDASLLLELLRTPDGAALSEEQLSVRLEACLEASPKPQASPFALAWGGPFPGLPVEVIAPSDVAKRFGFVAHPLAPVN